ncbi:MAG: tRNA-binding protein [Fimbriimonadaceae bacterium]|nr:tRNA-binding protein [Fimbriimonadaceae bacterium]QYK55919.1 MAG: tRNA-binding protein [Fimbriimonadaceae bacterium]
METVSWDEFAKVEARVGTVVRAEPFPEARKPAVKLWVDFGELGVLASSAQLTVHYTPESLVGRQVVGVLNLGPRRIAGFESQFLTTGFPDSDGAVVLCVPDKPVPNGAKFF